MNHSVHSSVAANVDHRVVVLGRPHIKDLVALTKPNITLMSVLVGLGCMLLAPGTVSIARATMGLAGIALSVMGAGALNMYLERDLDGKMTRTKTRPLPARRLHPLWAITIGLVLGGASIPVMHFAGGPLPSGLTVVALIGYVALYTPMKQKSPWALIVGAVPGAMPCLMGYAIVGELDFVAWTLFAVLFFWQLPHFLAIGMYREQEYLRAGHKLFNHGRSKETARAMIIATSLPLIASAILLWPLGVGSVVYGVLATVLSLWFMSICVRGFERETANKWGRKVFLGTLVFQVGIFGGLAADVGLRALFGLS